MPEVKVARLREDRGDVIVRSGLWHGWWKTSEGSPTKIQLKKPEMIATSKSAHRNSNFIHESLLSLSRRDKQNRGH